MERCTGSGKILMLSWLPDPNIIASNGKKYPGAVVCDCSFGVLVVQGSARKAISESGFEGMSGKVRVHYINKDLMTYRKPTTKE